MLPIKVCHVASSHLATDNRIYLNESLSLHKVGYEVTIVTPRRDDFMDKNIVHIACGGSVRPLLRVSFTAYKAFKASLEVDADIYHLHDIELLRYAMAYQKIGKKVIFDCHENWLDYPDDISWIGPKLKRLAKKYISYLYKKYLVVCDAVIGVSPHIIRSISKYNKNVFMVTNYPRINEKEQVRYSYDDYVSRDRVIIFAGTISDQECIIKSLDHIPNVKYKLIGKISPEYKDKLNGLPGADKVEFIPFLDKGSLQHEYSTARIAIIGLKYSANVGYEEGTLGNTKIFDYMKHQLPLACTDFKIWKSHIIEKYNCGECFSPTDPHSIASAISYLLDNPEIAYQKGINSLSAVEMELNWKTQEELLLRIYAGFEISK